MTDHLRRHSLKVAQLLADPVERRLLPRPDVDPGRFWIGYEVLPDENRRLSARRDQPQRTGIRESSGPPAQDQDAAATGIAASLAAR